MGKRFRVCWRETAGVWMEGGVVYGSHIMPPTGLMADHMVCTTHKLYHRVQHV